MKRNVRVKATDSMGTTIELIGKIDTGNDGMLMRHEVSAVADDLERRLTAVLPELRYTSFKVRMVVKEKEIDMKTDVIEWTTGSGQRNKLLTNTFRRMPRLNPSDGELRFDLQTPDGAVCANLTPNAARQIIDRLQHYLNVDANHRGGMDNPRNGTVVTLTRVSDGQPLYRVALARSDEWRVQRLAQDIAEHRGLWVSGRFYEIDLADLVWTAEPF